MPTEVIVKIIESPIIIKVRQTETTVVGANFAEERWTADGDTAIYTLANISKSGSLNLFLNGISQEGGGIEYTLAGDLITVTFITTPPIGWTVRANYAY